jgi:hypothetical protein
MTAQYRLAKVLSPTRLRDVAEFNVFSSGARDVPVDVLARWWRFFPDGIRLAEDPAGRIIGIISLWPVRSRVYDAIRIGRYSRAQLAQRDFEPRSGRRPRWFMSGMSVAPELAESSRFMRGFVRDALNDIRRTSGVRTLSICALADDLDAERALRRFSFERTSDGRFGAVYELQAL